MVDEGGSARGGQHTGIDWEHVRHRVEETTRRLQKAGAPDAQERLAVLRRRAQDLAKQEVQTGSAPHAIRVLRFMLGSEQLAIELEYVREVLTVRGIAPLPCVPEFILGIVNARGLILSVISLKALLGIRGAGTPEPCTLVVLEGGEMSVGIQTDGVLGVRVLERGSIQACPPTLTGIRRDWLRGVTPDQVAILDADRILTDRRIAVHEEVSRWRPKEVS